MNLCDVNESYHIYDKLLNSVLLLGWIWYRIIVLLYDVSFLKVAQYVIIVTFMLFLTFP